MGLLVWKGAIPREELAQLGRQRAGWSKTSRRQLGRAVLRILHRVWRAYAEQFDVWKENYGIEQWEWVQKHRGWQQQKAAASDQQLYRRTRLELCMGELCRARRGLGATQERRVFNLPFRKCKACEQRLNSDTAALADAGEGYAFALNFADNTKDLGMQFPSFRNSLRRRRKDLNSSAVGVGWRRYQKLKKHTTGNKGGQTTLDSFFFRQASRSRRATVEATATGRGGRAQLGGGAQTVGMITGGGGQARGDGHHQGHLGVGGGAQDGAAHGAGEAAQARGGGAGVYPAGALQGVSALHPGVGGPHPGAALQDSGGLQQGVDPPGAGGEGQAQPSRRARRKARAPRKRAGNPFPEVFLCRLCGTAGHAVDGKCKFCVVGLVDDLGALPQGRAWIAELR